MPRKAQPGIAGWIPDKTKRRGFAETEDLADAIRPLYELGADLYAKRAALDEALAAFRAAVVEHVPRRGQDLLFVDGDRGVKTLLRALARFESVVEDDLRYDLLSPEEAQIAQDAWHARSAGAASWEDAWDEGKSGAVMLRRPSRGVLASARGVSADWLEKKKRKKKREKKRG